MNDDMIREERKRLRIRKEKDLHNGLVDRTRRESPEENWDLAESVFTPEELAEVSLPIRRARSYLMIDTAVFWLSILFLTFIPTDTVFGDPYPGIEVLLIGLLFVSFFGWFVLFFQGRSLRQDFTREFALRLERKKRSGNRTPDPDPARETIGFRRDSGTPGEETP